MTDPRPHWHVAPCFVVDDVVATAAFYRDKLGFRYERFWGDPPRFTMVRRNGVVIMLSQLAPTGAPGAMRPNGRAVAGEDPWDAYVWVDDADALYEEFTATGVAIARPPCDQPYGCRDFDVVDLNGFRLCFGHDLEG
jgi:predicted enzyme related to lactoylglutathione lyase